MPSCCERSTATTRRVAVLARLNTASKGDIYVADRLEKAQKKQDRHGVRTLKQAMALALADEADLVEERQSIMAMMVGRGQEPPFNYLIASLRQSALLLDPDNGDVRLSEVQSLYPARPFRSGAAHCPARQSGPSACRGARLLGGARRAGAGLDGTRPPALLDRALQLGRQRAVQGFSRRRLHNGGQDRPGDPAGRPRP